MRSGRFFRLSHLNILGEIRFHKLHSSYTEGGKERGIASEIAVGTAGGEARSRGIVYVTHPHTFEGFEFYRTGKDGYAPLFVLRDRLGKVLYGAYAPLQAIRQADGTEIHRSGTTAVPGSFNFPADPRFPSVLSLQTTYHPDAGTKVAGDVSLQVWSGRRHGQEAPQQLFSGRAAYGERVRVGEYFLSMDEVRYWTSMNVTYRPGLPLIFASFWITFGGLVLNLFLKVRKTPV